MSSALGVLKWQPSEFWGASFYEFNAGMNGYLASKGIKVDSKGMTREEYLDLKDEARRNGKEV
jgi:hypothetical protein